MARKSRKNKKADAVISSRAALLPSWIYARISNLNEHAEPSIENQIDICKSYINTNDDLIFEGVFTDLGYSGTNFERPGYSDMIAGVLCGKVKCIVVKDLSRLGRTYIEIGELLFDTFTQCGIRFISVTEDYDTEKDDVDRKKLFVLFKNLMNHMYSLDLRKKIRTSIALKKQHGEPLGLPPYGYCRSEDKKRFEIDYKAAEIVKLIFYMRLNGDSTYSIARYLNEKQSPTPQQYRNQGKKDSSELTRWSVNAVSRILHNRAYTGSLIQDKYSYNEKRTPNEKMTIKEDTHPAIISSEQFEAVAQLMHEAAIKYKKKNRCEPPDTRYSGKIFCSRCGKAAVRCESRKTEGAIFYYNCRYCIDDVKDKGGFKRASYLPLSKLDTIVIDVLRNCMQILSQFEYKIELLPESALFRRKKQSIDRDRTELEKIIYNHEQTLLSAYTHHLSGLIDIREYSLVRDKIEKDKLAAERQLAQTIIEKMKYDIDNIRNNQWLVSFAEFRNFNVPTKEMVQTLIRRIYLMPLANEVTIELNFMDSFEELQEIMQEIEVGQ